MHGSRKLEKLAEAVKSKYCRELKQAVIMWMNSVFTKNLLMERRKLWLTTVVERHYFRKWASSGLRPSKEFIKYLVTSSGVEED